MRAILGHVYTVGRHLVDRFRPPPLPEGEPWSGIVSDPRLGEIPLSGMLHPAQSGTTLVVLIHGLGGSIDSGYIRRMTAAAHARGLSVFRLNLRGADRGGDDIYHAGLTADLRAALDSPELAGYDSRVVVGYSLGGNMSLRFAGEYPDDLAAVVTVCSPLDLDAGATFIDSRRRRIYCRHLLVGLAEIYERSAPSIGSLVGLSPGQARAISSIREWDEKIVARRFGFAGAKDYYESASAADVLASIEAPVLVVRSVDDPMVHGAAAALDKFGDEVTIWRVRGGHIGFAKRAGMDERILDWIASRHVE